MANDKGLCRLDFNGATHHENALATGVQHGEGHTLLVKVQKQLEEYFAGKRREFDLKLAPHGTIFQLMAWRELQNIPYAQTISYAEQARRMGDSRKARAVGAANGRNPLAIIVPCHRVIGTSGSLVGFAGGLKTKEFLLELESRVAGEQLAA
jgi:methylated-DNA-[protein]-cysteine S-methyltransferase